MITRTTLYLLGALLTAMTFGARAAPPERVALSGPIPAIVERVIDGDTVRVRARIWLAQELLTDVRLRGIDAPELHGRCAAERDRAQQAKAWLDARIGGRRVSLSEITGDKYGGRVVARLATQEGDDVSTAMLAMGLAQPYNGRRKTRWCED
jgi:endonuclease YncB( thermonuclease family)